MSQNLEKVKYLSTLQGIRFTKDKDGLTAFDCLNDTNKKIIERYLKNINMTNILAVHKKTKGKQGIKLPMELIRTVYEAL